MSAATEVPAGSRRERILDAAITEFAARGHDGATWRRIAERAGVNQGLIRFYFEDKEGLWRAAFRLAHERRTEGMPPPVALPGMAQVPREAVADWLRAFVRHVARHTHEARMILQEGAQDDPEGAGERMRWAAEEALSRAHAEFLEGVEVLQAAGWFEGFEPHNLLYLMVGASQYVFLVPGEVTAVRGADPLTDDAVAGYAEDVVRLFMAHAPGGSSPSRSSSRP